MNPKPFLLSTAIIVALLTGVLASTATAQDPSDSATGTVEISQAVRSVTVSPNTFEFDDCHRSSSGLGPATDGLTFPNGMCEFDAGVIITNGDEPAHIHVRAENFTGSDGVGEWALVGELELSPPGVDEIALRRPGPSHIAPTFTFDICDAHWNVHPPQGEEPCLASPGQVMTQTLFVVGPSASTNDSPSWSTTVTWTAMP